ncbi:MAG TPA: hypothetical protein VKR58_10930 [Aquella sp.]|nr:hypothetical protein [Aquella sp.]
MNKESLVKVKLDYQNIGEEISHELGAKMIKNHHDKYSHQQSHSYIIGKNIIETILAQPGCVGIAFADAINEFGNKTLVYVGLDVKGNAIIELTTVDDHGKLAVTPAMIGDRLLPPPTSWFD